MLSTLAFVHSSIRIPAAGGLRWAAMVLLSMRLLAAESLGAISGTVFDPVGNPAQFVEITLLRDHTDFRRTLAADSHGRFRFDGLAPARTPSW